MLMRLNGRAGQPDTRSATGCAAPARRTGSRIHHHPHPAEHRAAAQSTATAHAPVTGRRRVPVHVYRR